MKPGFAFSDHIKTEKIKHRKYFDESHKDFIGSRGFSKADTKTALEQCQKLVKSFKANHPEFANDLSFEGYTPNKAIETETVHPQIAQPSRIDHRPPSPSPLIFMEAHAGSDAPPPKLAEGEWVGLGPDQ